MIPVQEKREFSWPWLTEWRVKMLVTSACCSLDATKLRCFPATLWHNFIITNKNLDLPTTLVLFTNKYRPNLIRTTLKQALQLIGPGKLFTHQGMELIATVKSFMIQVHCKAEFTLPVKHSCAISVWNFAENNEVKCSC